MLLFLLNQPSLKVIMLGVAVVMTYAGDFKDDYNKIFCLHFSDIRDVVVDTKSVCA